MEKIFFIAVLCVILVVSQVEMVPVGQMSSHVALEGQSSAVEMTNALNRVKRTVLGFNGCPKDMVKLWSHGPCVDCDVYMEYKDVVDCPTNG